MDFNALVDKINRLTEGLQEATRQASDLQQSAKVLGHLDQTMLLDPWVVGITVFALACFVGYYVVWRVTPALHSPLMAVTNAISSVIIVGALLAAGPEQSSACWFGFLAVMLASINIFGGFIVTDRMLSMFSSSKK